MKSKKNNTHIQLIFDRYADRENIGVVHTSRKIIEDVYLKKIISLNEIYKKNIFEIGAGCSQYIDSFLENGCSKYFANDLISERLNTITNCDSRIVKLTGNFMDIDLPVGEIDIVFATLTMMFLIPTSDEVIRKISRILRPGGIYLGMDPNYLCPVSVYRRFADIWRPNPARLFNPFSLAKKFEENGFQVETLIPFTGPFPSTTGSWVLGTTFWLRARKI